MIRALNEIGGHVMDERVMNLNLHNENNAYNETNLHNENNTYNEQGDYNFQKIIIIIFKTFLF